MELTTGQEIWLAFATERSSDGNPYASVTQATVIDGENRVIRRQSGTVSVLSVWSVETTHLAEADAWRTVGDYLMQRIVAIGDLASKCHGKAAEAAAAASIVKVPA